MTDVPPQFGVAYSRNITGHATKGIGAWTDGEIVTLLRTGIARDGRFVPPWMIKLPLASDEDIASIVAFLRSDDPWVQPVDVASRESQPSFFTKLLMRTVIRPLPFPERPIEAPPAADRAASGRYLAGVLQCYGCHSADFATVDDLVPERSKGFYGGGNAMPDLNGVTLLTANITPDPETGIGAWTEAQFRRAVKEGFRPDNSPLRYPMDTYVELSDDEVAALFAYLRTVPPLRQAVTRAPNLVSAATDPGEVAYHKYACQSCHGETGIALCDLRKNPEKFPSDAELVAFLRNPAATVPGSKMPAWEGVIEDADYTPLVGYVRRLARAPYRAGDAAAAGRRPSE